MITIINKTSLRVSMLCMAVCLVTLTGCDKNNDTPDTPINGSMGKVLMETTVKNADGMSGSSYIQLLPDMTGTVSMKNGTQVGFSSAVHVEGNQVFSFPEFGAQGTQYIVKYNRTEQGLQKAGQMEIPPMSYPNNITFVNATKAYIPLYSLGRVLVVNPETMQRIGEIDLTAYAHHDTGCEPSYGMMHNGKYYLPLNQVNERWMPYPDYRQVDLLVIDPATDKVTKVISETTSGLSFPTRPFLKSMIFENEAGDLYLTCCGSFGYDPTYLKSGFVCLPHGSDAFDTSRSWDVSNTFIEGTEHAGTNGTTLRYKPATVFNACYIGGGKIAAYVGILELATDNPYTAKNSMAVIMDLNTRTIRRIADIPITDGHSVFIQKYGSEVYFSAYGTEASGVFSYNPETNKSRQVLKASCNVVFFHFFE